MSRLGRFLRLAAVGVAVCCASSVSVPVAAAANAADANSSSSLVGASASCLSSCLRTATAAQLSCQLRQLKNAAMRAQCATFVETATRVCRATCSEIETTPEAEPESLTDSTRLLQPASFSTPTDCVDRCEEKLAACQAAAGDDGVARAECVSPYYNTCTSACWRDVEDVVGEVAAVSTPGRAVVSSSVSVSASASASVSSLESDCAARSQLWRRTAKQAICSSHPQMERCNYQMNQYADEMDKECVRCKGQMTQYGATCRDPNFVPFPQYKPPFAQFNSQPEAQLQVGQSYCHDQCFQKEDQCIKDVGASCKNLADCIYKGQQRCLQKTQDCKHECNK